MAVMEIHRESYINTTSIIGVAANQTGTVQYLFDKNIKVGFSTSGVTGATATTISFSFTSAKVISHIFLQNHNLKDFNIYYNGVTASSLYTTSNNSATSSYLGFASITVNSVHIQINDVITSGQERRIGEFVITERRYAFERNPPINRFNYSIPRKQVRHEMPDGGIVLFNIRNKYRTVLKPEFFSQTSHDTLFSIYDDAVPLYYVPFPTATAWDGKAFPVVWPGPFDFQYSNNFKETGYSGSILFEEEPAG